MPVTLYHWVCIESLRFGRCNKEIPQKDGNLYHKDEVAANPTLIQELNLVDAEYLFNKYYLKNPTSEVSNNFHPDFTTFEDTLVRKAKELDMVG